LIYKKGTSTEAAWQSQAGTNEW